VVTADDLGLSGAVNDGVVAAHLHGIVTAASLMVRRPHAGAAADAVRALPGLAVGLHLDLASFHVVDGSWTTTEQVVDPADADAVAAELDRQLERFHDLLGRPPTHLDSHHHLHQEEPVRSAVAAAAERLGVPVRGQPGLAYCGAFYGQYGAGQPWPDGITPAALVAIIGGLEAGTTELACHPATGTDPAHGTYDAERATELASLCHPDVRAGVEAAGVELAHPKRPDT
jgi:predicted glycoside hydrolase/deacetylase ChbG (UPF0249 family)